jgi:hypothetical protein
VGLVPGTGDGAGQSQGLLVALLGQGEFAAVTFDGRLTAGRQ